MGKTLEEELIETLSPLIGNGSIQVISDDAPFIQAISSGFPRYFPYEGSIAYGEVDEEDSEFSLAWLDAFCLAADVLPTSMLIVVGDNVLNNAYSCQAAILRQYLKEFVTLPQHTYILTSDGKWCLCFRFEGDVGYGQSTIK